MTPTPALLLTVALFWTLPASAAVLTYRTLDSSAESIKESAQRTIESLSGQTLLQPQLDG